MKKCFLFLMFVGVASIASADTLLCDFEDGTLQGWQIQNQTEELIVTTNPMTGSLCMAVKPGQYDEDNFYYTGFDWSAQWNGSSTPAFDPAVTPIIQMEVTWIASEWVGLNWLNFELTALNSSNGWSQVAAIDPVNPSWPGSWDPSWGDHTRTLQWDYTGYSVAGITWGPQIQIATNIGQVDQSGYYYIDNVRLITPEPATMTMLGLGALALLRKKK